jgi:hypothetical protein
MFPCEESTLDLNEFFEKQCKEEVAGREGSGYKEAYTW